MRTIRPVLFWTHLVAGVISGVVVLIMSVTGVLLTYQKQMTLWADLRGVEAGPPTPNAERLTPDSLLSLVAARESAGQTKTPTNVVWRYGATMPVEVQFGREGRQYLSAYTGEVVGTGSVLMRKVFQVSTDWHRWLAMKDDSRATGKLVTGVSNLAFLVLVLTGMVLWWPRNLTWKATKQVLVFRRGLSAKARDFNWHNVIGIWSAIPLAAVVASATVISFPWASDLVYRVVGEEPPARAEAPAPAPAVGTANRGSASGGSEGRGSEGRGSETAKPGAPLVGDVYALAAQRMPDWRSMSLAWPKAADAPLVYSIDRGMGGEPHKRATLTISRTGDAPKWAVFGDQSVGRRARSIMRFTHTGEVLGFWGQTIAGLVSLGGAVLVYTGLALSLRRFVAWRRRAASAAPVAAEVTA
ncbi:MAG: PepSY domain-containing protein [Gemmatimonadaceae bacterium]|nr:PepSY domain-containing protein [Gemmatimonadaceae bacterium]